MDQSQLRLISGFLRRRWWIIVQAVLVVGLVAGWLAYRKPERPYQATAVVQVAPNENDSPYVTNNTPFSWPRRSTSSTHRRSSSPRPRTFRMSLTSKWPAACR